jgi:hypothetical protein
MIVNLLVGCVAAITISSYRDDLDLEQSLKEEVLKEDTLIQQQQQSQSKPDFEKLAEMRT